MTFCKEMSSRVEEPFCKNICFLGIDTKYCSDLYNFVHVFDSPQSLGGEGSHLASFQLKPVGIFKKQCRYVQIPVGKNHIDSTQVLYRLGSLQNAKVLLPYRGGVFILGSFLGLPAPCHFVRHSSSFRAAMAAIFGFGGGTNFLLGVVLAEDGQESFASCKCDDVHGYLMCFFCTCSFVFIFLVLM